MRKKITQLFKGLQLFALILTLSNLNAQTAVNFQNTIQNVVQTSDRTLEFDIYLLNTDIGQTMELASYQAGITLNPGIYTGGALTASIVSGTSTLTNSSQVPSSITYTASATIIKIAAKAPPGAGSGSIISQVSPGTHIITVRLTSTVAFTPNSTPDFFFAPSTAVNPSYPTAVALYIDVSPDIPPVQNIQQPVTMGVNAFVLENPFLNPPVSAPSPFSVTGGGAYCQGAGGLPVGVANSETGVTYILIKDETPTTNTVSGTTGSSISFGNQPAGTYTVIGSNIGGTASMTGEAVLTEISAPVAPTLGLITQPTCVLETGNIILTGLPIGSWTINPGNITGSTINTTISELSASSYAFTVTASGCTSMPSGNVVINSQPLTPTKPLISQTGNDLESSSSSGNQWYYSSGIIVGATNQIYTPPTNGNYYVVVTNTDGCISEPSDIISFTTGVEKLILFEGISIYPNPARDYLTIENNKSLDSIDFEIMNSNGEKIYNSILIRSSIIEINQFSSGIYFIRFKNGNFYHLSKFIKQ